MSEFEFKSDLKPGDRVSTVCGLSKGTPPFRFSWHKNGTPFLPDASKKILTGDDVSTISFSSLNAEDTANYTCIVENAFGSDQYTAQLIVNCEYDHYSSKYSHQQSHSPCDLGHSSQ